MGLEYDAETANMKRPIVDETGAVPAESFEIGNTLYARLQRVAGRFKIEQRGIERVPENERTDTSLVKVGTMVSDVKAMAIIPYP